MGAVGCGLFWLKGADTGVGIGFPKRGMAKNMIKDKLTRRRERHLVAVAWAAAGMALAAGAGEEPWSNRYQGHAPLEVPEEGLAWPAGQALPRFARPAQEMDTIEVQALSKDEQLAFSALQGHVNRTRPRIYLLNARSGEGRDTWPDTATVGLGRRRGYDRESKYDLLAKYAGELRGLVLYEAEEEPHMRNLAGTVAGLERAIPVTEEVLRRIRERQIGLPVVADLRELTLRGPLEVYAHLHERYWPRCEKRFLLSAKPHDEKGGGDYHHTRDLAAACGAAVVWLDNRIPEQRDLMRKFFADMKAGEAVVLGWYSTERSGVTTASEFGIGTLPADHYVSGSVLSGTDPRLRIPVVPRMPELEHKAYVALFISDGDNIQYTQHAMRQIWDEHAGSRGKVALNWTIAPGLADIGPGILNYYYQTATPLDCFVTGPSGMGYLMPANTLEEPGAPVGEYTRDPAAMAGYARLTETYLQRTGLRVATIWDNASPMQRQAYERHCRQLYGATVQNFRDVPSVASSVENGRLRFEKLVIPYAGTYEHMQRSLRRELRRWDRRGPLFLAYQVDIWGELKPHRLVALQREFAAGFPVEFVRADHFFNLRSRAEGLAYNLMLAPGTRMHAAEGSSEGLEAVADGSPSTLWESAAGTTPWVAADFGGLRRIGRCVLRHAGDHGLSGAWNTRDFTLLGSLDGKAWKTIGRVHGNTANVSDVEFPPVEVRQLRLRIDHAGADGRVRIADWEIHGSDK